MLTKFLALIRDDKKLLMKGVSLPPGKPQILVFTPTGKFLSSIKWKNGEIALIGWSNSEDLLIVQDDGTVYVYDIFGTLQNSFILDQEIRDTKIVECKLFNSSTGTGIAVLTGSYRFFVLNNIKEPKIRRLAEVPGLTSTPSSWAIIAKHKQTQLIVAKGDQVYLLDSSEKTCIPVLLQFSGQYNSIAEISVSFYSENIALFTDTGLLWLGETQNELRNKFCEFETQCKTCPQQLLWCGKDAVVSLWKNVLLAVGHDKDWLNYVVDEPVFCVEEVDGIRIIGNEVQEILQRVPQVVVDVFRIGSVSAGALLLEASKEFSRRSHKADEYLRMIRERKQIEYAVNQCIEAAGHEYTVSSQKMLLRAASFGKSFVPETNPECFVKMCETLRVLNAVRNYSIGIPLTYNQLMTLTMGVLLDRLILRRHYCLALRIASYLKIPEDEGTSRILANWACYKVKQTHIDDEKVARDISNKLGYAPGVSYAEVANKAIEQGRVQLAIRLLDHELRASEQVPLLLRLKQHNQALQKAIDSGDTNLIYTVIYRLRDVLSSGEFLMAIRNFPVAYSLYRKVNHHLLIFECSDRTENILKLLFFFR